ncbi:MAG: rhomboid family intramembrane serine protease [Acidimicrobiales bacterium]
MIPLHDRNPTRRRAWVTIALILGCIAVYFGVQPLGRAFVGHTTGAGASASCADLQFELDHAAIPDELTSGRAHSVGARRAVLRHAGCPATTLPAKNVWLSVLVSMFLHGGLLHLGGNMLFLWIFGNNIEDRLGRLRYLLFYLAAGVAATFTQVALDPVSPVPMIGASGAIAGVMGAYLVLYPRVQIKTLVLLVFIPIIFDLRAFWWLGIWFASQFFVSPSSGVAWAAHVGGFAFGIVVGVVARVSARLRRAPGRRDRARPDRGRVRPAGQRRW